MSAKLLAALAACCTAHGLYGQVTLIDLGVPGGGTSSAASAINENGVIAIRTDSEPYLRYPDGRVVRCGLSGTATKGELERLNINGVGAGDLTTGVASFQTITGARMNAPFNYTVFGPVTQARGINDAGTVVGRSNFAAAVFTGSTASLIPAPPGSNGTASGNSINNAGVIAFDATIPAVGGGPADSFLRAARFTPGQGSVMLPAPPNAPSTATDMNELGMIAGSTGGAVNPLRAVRWLPNNTLVTMSSPGAFPLPYAINNLGDVVGQAFTVEPIAVLWEGTGGAGIDLNELLSPQDQLFWRLWAAEDVNDARQVVGYGKFDPDGAAGPLPDENRAFLLQLPPVPEPASGCLLAAAGLLLRRARVRA